MRRHALIVAAGLIAAAGTVQAAEKVVWDWSIYGPQRAVTRQIEIVAKYVAEKSNGNFTFNLHYGEAISPAKAVLDGLKIGAFQGAIVAFAYAPGKAPLHLAPDLPFLPIPNLDVQQRVLEAFDRWEPAVKELDRWNTYALYEVLLPGYEFMGTGDPPKTIDGWKGMRVRALGPGGDAMRLLGAVPTSVTAPEVYNALERGTFQAASFPFAYAFGSYRLHEVSKWYTMGLAFGNIHNIWGVNRAALAKLPPEYRKMLEDVRAMQYQAGKDGYAAEDQKWIPIFDKTLERIAITPEMHRQYAEKAGRPVWDKWAADLEAQGLPGKQALEVVLEAAKKYADAKGS